MVDLCTCEFPNVSSSCIGNPDYIITKLIDSFPIFNGCSLRISTTHSRMWSYDTQCGTGGASSAKNHTHTHVYIRGHLFLSNQHTSNKKSRSLSGLCPLVTALSRCSVVERVAVWAACSCHRAVTVFSHGAFFTVYFVL
jgi:hypothetical protein